MEFTPSGKPVDCVLVKILPANTESENLIFGGGEVKPCRKQNKRQYREVAARPKKIQ